MSELDFEKIIQENRGSLNQGSMRWRSSELEFKNNKLKKSEHIKSDDIENLYWLKRAKGNCVKILTKSGDTHRFDGFHESDYERVQKFSSSVLKKPIEKTDVSVRGWNWGKPSFVGDSMNFISDNKTMFEIPLRNVVNTSVQKNEAVLQFHQNEAAQVSLMEVRFHVPSNTETDIEPAQDFIQKVIDKADIQTMSDADAICTLTELNCVTPRGRYDVKFFTDFIDLHGKTFDYKISYDHVLRLFLLPHKDGRQMYFVIGLDPPMKQGNTRYPFLIVLFNIDDTISVDFTFSEKTREKFGDRLDKLDDTIHGPYHEVVSRICRTLLDKRITVPGSFTTAAGSKCFPCSYKANSGFLYPLERGFMFVNKPPLHILFNDVSIVKFDRSSTGTRSFDFQIEHKNGTSFLFSGIDKAEQSAFQEFIKNKGMKIQKSANSAAANIEYGGKGSHDAYAEQMKAEGRERDDDDEDDSDDEDDDDFKAEESSDDDMEYDSNASVSSNDDRSGGSGTEDAKTPSPKKKSKKTKRPSASPKKKSKKSASPSSSSSNNKPSDSKPNIKSAEFVKTDSEDSG